jgi:hypothetical protein
MIVSTVTTIPGAVGWNVGNAGRDEPSAALHALYRPLRDR